MLKLASLRTPDMEPDAPVEMRPDTGPQAFAVAVFSWRAAVCPVLSAAVLKVTFVPLDIFLPRSKLRSNATPAITPGTPGLL